jgi:hypothetical protein
MFAFTADRMKLGLFAYRLGMRLSAGSAVGLVRGYPGVLYSAQSYPQRGPSVSFPLEGHWPWGGRCWPADQQPSGLGQRGQDFD